MKEPDRIQLLKSLQEIMQEIIKETSGDVTSYDRMTQEVSKAIGRVKEKEEYPSQEETQDWHDLQWKLFRVYLLLLNVP